MTLNNSTLARHVAMHSLVVRQFNRKGQWYVYGSATGLITLLSMDSVIGPLPASVISVLYTSYNILAIPAIFKHFAKKRIHI